MNEETFWMLRKTPNGSCVESKPQQPHKDLLRVAVGGIEARFKGKERSICKSLFSWVNDGSHYAMDDFV
ncbi:hypothetical protein [Duganella sp. HH101]|uniref:hypothetical protein n=1 Tax=Duganella sp. HH101 TaxID=1781066 RepID=UPI0008934C6C|nr:hypothetical protein [Duganella sp. HH101]OFA02902.1 hypothetical protein DUGA2_32090 [Duganella sp. HH101]OFA02973.1 hypothetical protein DUGA2_32800 [Duganella sp. HH101]